MRLFLGFGCFFALCLAAAPAVAQENRSAFSVDGGHTWTLDTGEMVAADPQTVIQTICKLGGGVRSWYFILAKAGAAVTAPVALSWMSAGCFAEWVGYEIFSWVQAHAQQRMTVCMNPYSGSGGQAVCDEVSIFYFLGPWISY